MWRLHVRTSSSLVILPHTILPRWFTLVDQVHYLHFGLLLWGISGVVMVGVSLATPPPPADSLLRLTWASR